MSCHRAIPVAATGDDPHDTAPGAAPGRFVVEAHEHDVRGVEHVGHAVRVVVGEVGNRGCHHDLTHAGDLDLFFRRVHRRLGRRPAAPYRGGELAGGRPELTDLDGVAPDTDTQARLAELVDLAVLSERTLVEERDAGATDTSLVALATERAVHSTKLARVTALRDA